MILKDDFVHYNDVKDFVPYLQNHDLSNSECDDRKFRDLYLNFITFWRIYDIV